MRSRIFAASILTLIGVGLFIMGINNGDIAAIATLVSLFSIGLWIEVFEHKDELVKAAKKNSVSLHVRELPDGSKMLVITKREKITFIDITPFEHDQLKEATICG